MCAINGVSDISKGRDASSAMRFYWPGWWKTEGFLKKMSCVDCMYGEEFRNHRVDSRCLLCDPGRGGYVILYGSGSGHVLVCRTLFTYTCSILTQWRNKYWIVGQTDRAEKNSAHCRYSLCYSATLVVPLA